MALTRVCGPKCSMCCLVLSVWGIIQLLLMGIFLRIKAPAFVEDLPIVEEDWEHEGLSAEYIDRLFEQLSTNCFIASGMYVATLVLSVVMWKVNQRASYNMS